MTRKTGTIPGRIPPIVLYEMKISTMMTTMTMMMRPMNRIRIRMITRMMMIVWEIINSQRIVNDEEDEDSRNSPFDSIATTMMMKSIMKDMTKTSKSNPSRTMKRKIWTTMKKLSSSMKTMNYLIFI